MTSATTSEGFSIQYLKDHPQHLPTVAAWHHGEWAYLREHDTLEARMARLREECGHREIPTTMIAFQGSTPIGSAALLAEDMDTRMDLTPWLASVFVLPEHRRKGIGAALVQRITEEARTLGIERLYLYTPSQEQFYARLGWSVLERTDYHGPVTIMCLALKGAEAVASSTIK